jgi:hypothetical protein
MFIVDDIEGEARRGEVLTARVMSDMISGKMTHISVEEWLDRQMRIGTSMVTYRHLRECWAQILGMTGSGESERDWWGEVVRNQGESEIVAEKRERSGEEEGEVLVMVEEERRQEQQEMEMERGKARKIQRY